MNERYEPVIGLEIHAELQTLSKMFCGCPVVDPLQSEPNTAVCPVCVGLPGALPVINRHAVDDAILVGLALECKINRLNFFDRKNYFYPDLPKGYQISQNDHPVARGGRLNITPAGGQAEQIGIRRVHIEEDTAKLFHVTPVGNDYCLVDFNRSGVPLLEIVSEPDLHSIEAMIAYATKIRSILRCLGVNSGDMEKGVLRFEANVSIRPVGSQELGTRTEIKNLNSFRTMARAVSFEIDRQARTLRGGGTIVQETLGWDEARGSVISQRSKESAHDYRYFPEPDLPPFEVDEAWVEEMRRQMPELPDARCGRFVDHYGLAAYDAQLVTADPATADFFEAAVAAYQGPPKAVSNWITGELFRLMKESGTGASFEEINVRPDQLADLLQMVDARSITQSSAKEVLAEIFATGKEPKAVVAEKGLTTIADTVSIAQVVERVLDGNPEQVAQFLGGKQTTFEWLLGQVMKQTRGKADPQAARQLLDQALRSRRS
jgi:aspartyl-tRNA(Asn)/glutamyl-tRNA(Gln) amidotransferase subunit B